MTIKEDVLLEHLKDQALTNPEVSQAHKLWIIEDSSHVARGCYFNLDLSLFEAFFSLKSTSRHSMVVWVGVGDSKEGAIKDLIFTSKCQDLCLDLGFW